jgi:hypothetical protein
VVAAAGAVFNFDPGLFQCCGGTLFTNEGGTLLNAGSLTITGAAPKSINTNTLPNSQINTLDNEGFILWTGTGVILCFNGVILNNGASFDIQTNDSSELLIFNNGGLPATFINVGTLTKSAGGR